MNIKKFFIYQGSNFLVEKHISKEAMLFAKRFDSLEDFINRRLEDFVNRNRRIDREHTEYVFKQISVLGEEILSVLKEIGTVEESKIPDIFEHGDDILIITADGVMRYHISNQYLYDIDGRICSGITLDYGL